jgi:hypothetical protein
MKCTWLRCQLALSTLARAALMPSCASETTSLTPHSPRRASLRRNAIQDVSASDGPMSNENLTPAATVDADRYHRDRDYAAILAHLHVSGVDPQIEAVVLDRVA